MTVASLFDLLSRSQLLSYLDPGSGSLVLQMLLGGVAGVAIAIKLFWGRIISFFKPGNAPADEQLPKRDPGENAG